MRKFIPLILTASLLFLVGFVFAQVGPPPAPPPPPPPTEGVPIDGGVILLLSAGLIYGGVKLYNKD